MLIDIWRWDEFEDAAEGIEDRFVDFSRTNRVA